MLDFFKIIKSRSGNAMTTSLMVTGASAAISAFLFSQSLSTDQAAKIPRIKSAMNQVEISLRAMILQPGTFTCTQAGATADANCKINLAFLASLERELPGADSGTVARCKIAIQDAGIGVAGNVSVNGSPFVATLKYICASDSAESKIASQKISVDIPGEVTTVSADTFTCADIDINKPILVGFTSSSGGSTGGIKCAALKNATCPANQFVSAIDYKTMKVTCSQVSSTAVAAASTEMLGGLTWTGDTFTQTSLTRKNPSAYPAVGPMFTMISSKNTSLVGKPADVPNGGSCVCDVPKTTCWNGDQVCIPAGESCPATPAPSPSVAASSTPDASCTADPNSAACICNAIPAYSWGGGNCSGDVPKTAKGSGANVTNTNSGFTGNVTGTCAGNDQWINLVPTCTAVTSASPSPNTCSCWHGYANGLDFYFALSEFSSASNCRFNVHDYVGGLNTNFPFGCVKETDCSGSSCTGKALPAASGVWTVKSPLVDTTECVPDPQTPYSLTASCGSSCTPIGQTRMAWVNKLPGNCQYSVDLVCENTSTPSCNVTPKSSTVSCQAGEKQLMPWPQGLLPANVIDSKCAASFGTSWTGYLADSSAVDTKYYYCCKPPVAADCDGMNGHNYGYGEPPIWGSDSTYIKRADGTRQPKFCTTTCSGGFPGLPVGNPGIGQRVLLNGESRTFDAGFGGVGYITFTCTNGKSNSVSSCTVSSDCSQLGTNPQ